jgi:hypothetical protein
VLDFISTAVWSFWTNFVDWKVQTHRKSGRHACLLTTQGSLGSAPKPAPGALFARVVPETKLDGVIMWGWTREPELFFSADRQSWKTQLRWLQPWIGVRPNGASSDFFTTRTSKRVARYRLTWKSKIRARGLLIYPHANGVNNSCNRSAPVHWFQLSKVSTQLPPACTILKSFHSDRCLLFYCRFLSLGAMFTTKTVVGTILIVYS